MASEELNFTLHIKQVMKEVEQHYEQLITGLTSRRDSILNALKALNERYLEMNKKRIDDITFLDVMSERFSSNFKDNHSLDMNTRDEHAKLCNNYKESAWAKLEDSFVRFDHDISIRACISNSGSIQLEGYLMKSIDSLNVDLSVFKLDKSLETQDSILEESQVLLDSLQFSPNYVSCEMYSQSLPASLSKPSYPFLNSPSAVCVDSDTGLVYAADGGKETRVIVFSTAGEYMKEILPRLSRQVRGSVVLYGVCVRKDRLYLSDTHNNVIIAIRSEGGEFVASTHVRFQKIQNIAVDPENGHVFACDKTANKIRTFDEDLVFKYQFGERFLSGPRDVKIRRDKVIVLDGGDYSLCYFTRDGVLLGHSITFFSSYTPFLGGIFSDKTSVRQFFDVDEDGNTYVTNVNSPYVHKFDVYGGYVSYFGDVEDKKAPYIKGIAVIDGRSLLTICTKKTSDQVEILKPSK